MDGIIDNEWFAVTLVQFLPLPDVSNLSKVSKKAFSMFGVKCTKVVDVAINAFECSDDYLPWFQFIALSVNTHSVIVRGKWRDQNWGNKKGALSIQRRKIGGVNCLDNWQDEIQTMHLRDRLENREEGGMLPFYLRFPVPPDGENWYSLWYKVGGGGGHSLHFKNVVVYKAAPNCLLPLADRLIINPQASTKNYLPIAIAHQQLRKKVKMVESKTPKPENPRLSTKCLLS